MATFAPASASAMAIPAPSPRDDPVTSALLPFRPNFSSITARPFSAFFRLDQIRNCQGIHIVVDLILSTHTPAEHIVLGSNSGVNRPTGRDDDLFVRHDDVARLLARTHQMHYPLAGFKIEVKINFRPPHVRMRRHGVPDAARGELGKAHH